MIVRRTFDLRSLTLFAWKNALFTVLWATAVWAAHEHLSWRILAIPFLPVATIGTAVAFYVGFKNNSAYDRLWEGRKIWGSVVNLSRAWAAEVVSVVGHRQREEDPAAVAAAAGQLIRRHVAWVQLLRLQLRRPNALNASLRNSPQIRAVEATQGPPPEFEQEARIALETCAPEVDAARLLAGPNPAIGLLHLQIEQLTELKRRGWLDDFEHSDLKGSVMSLVDAQGAAERIKTFPFPRQYANFSYIFVKLFILLLPLGLLQEMGKLGEGYSWLIIPFSLLISWVFYSMEQVGDASENPFEGGINDVPMSAISRNIEIELRSMLGESALPQRLEPVNGVLL